MAIDHIIYINDIPDELSNEISNLYSSAYNTVNFIKIHNNDKDIYFFIITENYEMVHSIIYTMSRNELNALNHFFNIEDKYINYFSHYIFKNHKRIKAINISNLNNELSTLEHPFKPWRFKNDFIVNLPDSFESYQSMLGKRTRTNLRYYHNKIRRDFDDFSFTVQASEVIDPSNISKIIDLNRKRMRSQKITSVFDTDYEHKIIEFCRAYGVVGFITVKNRIVAGAICYQVGTHCYAHIISHDYDYSKYSIGMVCNLLLIEVLIKRGVQKFHLDTGEMEFKNRLLGVKKTTYNYTVYRNSAYKILGNIIYLRKYEYVSRLINFIKFRIVQNIKHSLARDPEKNEFK